MTEPQNKLKLEKRMDRMEKHVGDHGLRLSDVEKEINTTIADLLLGLRSAIGGLDTDVSLNCRINELENKVRNILLQREQTPKCTGACLTPDVLDTIHTTCNRLAREAISLNLGVTDVAPLHGARWANDDERKLYKQFNSFLRAQSVQLGRTESGLRIKLMRLLRDEHPVDWKIAGKER